MRYYQIVIAGADNGKDRVYASYVNGRTDPGALNIEMDIQVAPYATPLGGSYVRIWGIGLKDIGQSSNLNLKSIRVTAGMAKGLPLANPAQANLLVAGTIQQAFGNWQGVNMTLDLILTAGSAVSGVPNNIVVNWKAGTPFAAAVALALSTAFPTKKLNVNIDTRLTLAHDEPGFYGTLDEFAKYVQQMSQDVIGGTYQGVSIALRDDTFYVYDGSQSPRPAAKAIAFTDLIGQPTWLGPQQISVQCVMRGDLSIGDYVTLPPSQATTSAQSYSQYRDTSIQQGTFQIDEMRHVGNFRQPFGEAWMTALKLHTV